MKKLLFVLLLGMSASVSFSQDVQFKSGREKHLGKPQLFAKESAKFSVRSTFFNQILSYQIGEQVTVQLSPQLSFKGKVAAITHDAPGLETYILQSTTTEGLVLSLSKVQIPGEGVQYRGLLMSNKYSDMLMLEKDAITGHYVWNKKTLAHMIPD